MDKPAFSPVVGAILAGGHARRLGGVVKAALMVAGQPTLTHLRNRLSPQTAATVMCVAPRHVGLPWVTAAGLPVAVDTVEDGGPLAGIAAAMTWARAHVAGATAIVTVPVDTPFVPLDMVARLAAEAPKDGIAVTHSSGRRHPAIAYWPLPLTDDLAAHVAAGSDGAIHRFQSKYPTTSVEWPNDPFDPFFNINTPEDLETAAAIAATIRGGKGEGTPS